MTKNLYSYFFVDDLLDIPTDSAHNSAEQLRSKLMKDTAWLVLLCYTLLVFNPIMPIISDKIAHTFWLEYHLITVHGIYGNNHVEKELANNAKQSDKDKPSKSANEEYFHIIPKITYNFSSDYFISHCYTPFRYYSPVTYPDIDYLPPKV